MVRFYPSGFWALAGFVFCRYGLALTVPYESRRCDFIALLLIMMVRLAINSIHYLLEHVSKTRPNCTGDCCTDLFPDVKIAAEIFDALPEGLKELMNKLSIFNINLELARPECSIKWTATTKMDVVLSVPFGGVFLIACCEHHS